MPRAHTQGAEAGPGLTVSAWLKTKEASRYIMEVTSAERNQAALATGRCVERANDSRVVGTDFGAELGLWALLSQFVVRKRGFPARRCRAIRMRAWYLIQCCSNDASEYPPSYDSQEYPGYFSEACDLAQYGNRSDVTDVPKFHDGPTRICSSTERLHSIHESGARALELVPRNIMGWEIAPYLRNQFHSVAINAIYRCKKVKAF